MDGIELDPNGEVEREGTCAAREDCWLPWAGRFIAGATYRFQKCLHVGRKGEPATYYRVFGADSYGVCSSTRFAELFSEEGSP